jgi:hypothetical protein
MRFEEKYFAKHSFSPEQINKFLENSVKDLQIAKKIKILDVKFNYAYTSLIKAGITLLSLHQARVKSVPGHQVKIVGKMAEILEDDSIETMGNLMRSKRNLDLYAGGIEVTEKECKEYLEFVEEVIKKVNLILTNCFEEDS